MIFCTDYQAEWDRAKDSFVRLLRHTSFSTPSASSVRALVDPVNPIDSSILLNHWFEVFRTPDFRERRAAWYDGVTTEPPSRLSEG
jgi:hypothetical protein